MNRSKLATTFVAILCVFAFQNAFATIDDCNLMIDALELNTQAAIFFGQHADKDEAGLLGKLAAAQVKLNEGKFADAVKKIENFTEKLQKLADDNLVDQTVATALIEEANAAIAAIQALG